MDWNAILFLLVVILGLGYYLVQKQYSYWAERGVPFPPPSFPFGSLSGVVYKTTFGEKMREHYMALKGKGVIGGVFFFISPVAIILDLDLLRHVFVKDFQYFQNRGMYVNEKVDPLSAHLFAIEGDKWKNMRTKLSPTFTSGKMKMMHSTFLLVADQFKEHLSPMAAKGEEIEIKELLAQFTTDIIGNVAFGISCNSMKDPENAFRRAGRKVFQANPWRLLRQLLVVTFPNVGHMFKVKTTPPELSEFFLNLIRETVELREKNKIQRNDFLELLLQIKNTGKLDGETVDLGRLTFEELAAQTFLFFLAGFETSSSTMTFSAYELALDQEIQDKAREEIREVLERHNGVLSYEAAMECTYLDQIIHETLRKYPIVPNLRRKLTADYKVPSTDLVLKKGSAVTIPVYGIHHDPDIYPDPEKFIPERFTKENSAARHPMAWLPFGEGPRNCIGLRFGLMQTRVGLATILNNYRLVPSEKTLIPMKFQPSGLVLSPQGGMYLRIEKL